MTDSIPSHDIKTLRELAARQAAYARLPIMEERRRRWLAHNSFQPGIPMLVMETDTFEDSILPPPRCESSAGRRIERELMRWIINHELINDDKVIPSTFSVPWEIQFRLFDLDFHRHTADDGAGRQLGYRVDYPITDLSASLPELKPSVQSVDREASIGWLAKVGDIIGDILPVQMENTCLRWFLLPTATLISLMGMEAMMLAALDTPDEFNELLDRIGDDMLAHLRWQEAEDLLTLNNGNHYIGSGSYGFTTELPGPECLRTGRVTSRDLWVNMNSQESVGISPDMFGEFIFPHYRRLAEAAGLLYYGCCEPVHDIWDDYISRLPRLRKVSISAWCDEAMMSERLRGTRVIYSRKPSPNFIGIGAFDEEGYRAAIAATLAAAKGCQIEIIHRDIYTLKGDPGRAGRAIAIAREVIGC